jgi:hypothetical protein
MENLLSVTVGLILLLLAGILLLGIRLRQLGRQLAETEGRIGSLTDNLNALCSAAVGVDQRVLRLERQGRDLEHRQDSIESHSGHSDRPYGEAIQLVQKGASASQLVEKLGLSRSEAELVAMLHKAKQAD